MYFLVSLLIITLVDSCKSIKQEEMSDDNLHTDTITHKFTNKLVNETSPYLLQHAHNPVNWYPWGEEALEKAKKENKLIIVSIGYSACHWCHVMERESFENEEVAKIMNDHFISIKVDREERPDIDQIYMNAVHLMGQRGGWPLNCITLPNTKPIFAGTYFPANQWKNVLTQMIKLQETEIDKLIDYANQITEGIKTSELLPLNTEEQKFPISVLDQTVETWSAQFDNKEGGPNRAPKFPIPNNYQFLLRYGFINKKQEIIDHVQLTLKKMAYGGIYDQIGGGFARYSTDALWKAPHFEKMLYDNGQLISLYAEAFQAFKDPLYKDIVYQSIDFVERELMDKEGAFYSALDADSEGEEGKFYVWKKDELKSILKEDYDIFSEYYNVNSKGLWEHGNYILLRDKDDKVIADKFDINIEKLKSTINKCNSILMEVRNKRIRPGLDDKSLTSWNGLMLRGLTDSYLAFGEKRFLNLALKNAKFILSNQIKKDGGLYHSYKAGRSTINGYLEDYAFVIDAFIALYECTFDEKWLKEAQALTDYTIENFFDEKSGMLFFTSIKDEALIARKMEVNDNVIPASNSAMARNLYKLGHILDNQSYISKSLQMLNNIKEQIPGYGSGYSNWQLLYLDVVGPYFEVAIVGKDCEEKLMEFGEHYYPLKLFVGSEKESKIPLLELKYEKGITRIFVCENKVCQIPVEKVEEAVKQLK